MNRKKTNRIFSYIFVALAIGSSANCAGSWQSHNQMQTRVTRELKNLTAALNKGDISKAKSAIKGISTYNASSKYSLEGVTPRLKKIFAKHLNAMNTALSDSKIKSNITPLLDKEFVEALTLDPTKLGSEYGAAKTLLVGAMGPGAPTKSNDLKALKMEKINLYNEKLGLFKQLTNAYEANQSKVSDANLDNFLAVHNELTEKKNKIENYVNQLASITVTNTDAFIESVSNISGKPSETDMKAIMQSGAFMNKKYIDILAALTGAPPLPPRDDDDSDKGGEGEEKEYYSLADIKGKYDRLMKQPKNELLQLENFLEEVNSIKPAKGKDANKAQIQQAISTSIDQINNYLKPIQEMRDKKRAKRKLGYSKESIDKEIEQFERYTSKKVDYEEEIKALTVPAGDVKGGTWYINKYKFPVAVENLKGMVIFSGIDNKVGINEPFLQAFKDAKDSFKADTLQSARDFISTLKQLKKIKKPSGLKASATKLSLEMTKVLNNVKLTDPPKQDPPKQDPPKQDPPKQDPPKQDPPKSGDTGTKFAEYFKFPVAVENLKDMAIFTGTGNKVGINEAFLQAFKGAKDSFKSDTIQSARDFISTLKPLKKIKKPSGLKASATKLSLEMTQVLNSAAKK